MEKSKCSKFKKETKQQLQEHEEENEYILRTRKELKQRIGNA